MTFSPRQLVANVRYKLQNGGPLEQAFKSKVKHGGHRNLATLDIAYEEQKVVIRHGYEQAYSQRGRLPNQAKQLRSLDREYRLILDELE